MAKIKEEPSDKSLTAEEIISDKSYKGVKFKIRRGEDLKPAEKISTGSFFFDYTLGGGYLVGSWARFFGTEESGKTSMALAWAHNWQKRFGQKARVIYINAEGRIRKELLDRTGVDQSEPGFEIWDTNSADDAYDLIEQLILNNPEELKYFVIFDSTDAGIRRQDLDKKIGDREGLGGTATILSNAGKRLSNLFNSNDHFLFLVSQVRDKVNTHGPGGGGKDASGGNAPRFYSSLIGEFKKPWSEMYICDQESKPQSDENPIIGRKVQIKMHKTPNEKTGIIVEYPVKYGLVGGVWRAYEAMMVATAWDYYVEKQAWTTIVDRRVDEFKQAGLDFETKFQGKKAMREHFEKNTKLVDYILNQTRELLIN